MHQLTRTLIVLLGFAMIPFLAFGQGAASGAIAGRVVDAATKLSLAGVKITVKGTSLETYSEQGGDFLLTNVPAGAQLVEYSYIGYPDQQKLIQVGGGSTERVDLIFGDQVVTMDRFVIEGALVGQARAINNQRASATLVNAVASDELGRFPDQNAAESLQRVPGVSLYRDQGEGRYINLRGLNYIYTSVTLNGAKVASPESGDRGIALDVVPSDSLSMVEVTKVPTPDMDAEGLGGAVNVKTRSPFDSEGRQAQATVQGIYTNLTSKTNPKINGMYSDIFADGKFGVLFDFTWQERDFGSRNYEEDGLYTKQPSGFYTINSVGFRDYVINRERLGLNAMLEYRPLPETRFYVRGTYNDFTDTEDRHQLYVPFDGQSTLKTSAEESFSVEKARRFRRDLRMRTKAQDLTAYAAGFEHKTTNWVFDGQASLSKGEETVDNELVARFRHKDKDASYTYSSHRTYDINLVQTAGPSMGDAASYNELDRLELTSDGGTEDEANLALNARYNFDGAEPAYVKFGGSYRNKEKEKHVDISRFGVPSSFTFVSLVEGFSDYPYGPKAPRMSHDKLSKAFFGNRSAFTEDKQETDSLIEDWESEENILALYGMGSKTFGKTQLLGGVRYERTEFETQGYEVNTVDEDNDVGSFARIKADKSYDNFLPGLFLRHDFTKKLVGRMSYNQTIMRPSFGDSAMFRGIAHEDEEILVGNPDLEALTSNNIDASIEYYLPSLGLVSASVFFKQVENFSYQTGVGKTDTRLPNYEVITFRNGSDGDIHGLELAFQQQLRFLPAPFNHLGVMANATFTSSSATYPDRPGEKLPFIGQSKRTGNIALTYEKDRFFARLALNFRTLHLREDEPIGGNRGEDRYVDDHAQLDFSTSYRLRDGLFVFAEVANITNEPFRVFVRPGAHKLLVQVEEYDWSANFGLRWKL